MKSKQPGVPYGSGGIDIQPARHTKLAQPIYWLASAVKVSRRQPAVKPINKRYCWYDGVLYGCGIRLNHLCEKLAFNAGVKRLA